jgi:demethylmenaquinone methyltransferase/2-methoxy-6-polyprenyl-1,4-benzoquinol methylase
MRFDHFDFIAPLFARVGYASLEKMLEMADLPASGVILDVGGGTGRVAKLLCEHADNVIIADPSFGMLQQADRATLTLTCSNSESLPFPDGYFSRVIMVDALHHVVDQAATAREMYRVLEHGGKIVIEEPDIRVFGVKLIAAAEKVLLMRSHFLSPEKIVELFSFDSAKADVHALDGNAWVVIEKPNF